MDVLESSNFDDGWDSRVTNKDKFEMFDDKVVEKKD